MSIGCTNDQRLQYTVIPCAEEMEIDNIIITIEIMFKKFLITKLLITHSFVLLIAYLYLYYYQILIEKK